MKAIGLDIGTTTLCAAVLDVTGGQTLQVAAAENRAALPAAEPWRREQDPAVVAADCMALVDDMLDRHPDVAAIGLSGQMHGMLYVDAQGKALGSLRSWQDGRGNLPCEDGASYAQVLARATGQHAASGFGLVSLFYDTANGLVPKGARSICTIGDYVAMALCGGRAPLLHASNAASLGGYDLFSGGFSAACLPGGIDTSLLPAVQKGEGVVGGHRGIPVCAAVGDNQASVFGSLGSGVGALVNVGTGSQVSAVCAAPVRYQGGLECRPYVDGQYLSVGAALCGGQAYQLLRGLFAGAAAMMGHDAPADMYRRMDQCAGEALAAGLAPLVADTRFAGTRAAPALRGAITGIGLSNLTPGALCLGVLQGICRELLDFSKEMRPPLEPNGLLAASGNGLRNSPVSRRIFEEAFGMRVVVPAHREEAAHGAALIAACAAGALSFSQARGLVLYEDRV